MEHSPFTKDRPMHLTLADGFALVSAPERAFGIHYAVYRNANPEYEDFLEYGADLEGLNYCFWVLRDGQKISGIILRPNHVEGLFLRPPYADGRRVLQVVMPLLRSWSDPAKPIEAADVLPHELELYQGTGFQLDRARGVWIRPTESFDIRWDSRYDIVAPAAPHTADLAALFHASFREYPPQWELGSYSLQDWLRRTNRLLAPGNLAEECHQASTLVRDRASRQLAGACIIRLARSITRPDNPYAIISVIAVMPEHRRRGLGANMIRKALTALHGRRLTLKFGVAVGNSAEAIYQHLGFLAGPTQHFLQLRKEGTPS